VKSYGFVELPNLADAVFVLDVMLKAADISFETWQTKLGGRLVTIIVSGTVSAVEAAISAAVSMVGVKVELILANPHPEVVRIVEEIKKTGRI
jgi:microcompartment protein CcmL/EutN